MARINIEDSLWTDPRFIALSSVLGRWAAMGVMVDAFKIAQGFWLQGKLVPEDLWAMYNLPVQVETVGLIERRPDGVYVRGSEEQFSWLVQRSNAGKKNKGRSNEIRTLDRTERERKSNGSRTEVDPQSQSQSPSQNKEEREHKKPTSSGVRDLLEVWKETLSHFGIESMPAQSDVTMHRIITKYKILHDIRLALIGQRFERDNPPFVVKENLSLRRFLDNEKHFEKMNLLGSGQTTQKTWKAASDAVQPD